jgi:hypothetical protein
MPTKPVAKKPISGKPQAVKPAQKNVVQKKPAPDKTKGLRLLKETPQASLVQKKPAPKPAPDKVENLAKGYLAELKEVDVTFEKGTAVLEKYRAPPVFSYLMECASLWNVSCSRRAYVPHHQVVLGDELSDFFP